MRMIEIVALPNGAHNNQTYHGFLPDGWAMLPDSVDAENFPFGEPTVEEIEGVPTVTAWTAGEMPESAPHTAEEVRAERDKLLAETDWTQVLDAPITAACQEAFRVYRQALRDIPDQDGFHADVEWPDMPVVVKA